MPNTPFNSRQADEFRATIEEQGIALTWFSAMLDEKVLVRNIEHDSKPDWFLRQSKLVWGLKKAHNALDKARELTGAKP